MIWIYLILVLAFLLVLFVYFKSRNKKLSNNELNFFAERIQKISALSPREQIVEFDKLLDLALAKLGKQGTLGEKLKKSESLFKNINNVWRAHKVRNKIAHEVGFILADRDFKELRNIYLNSFSDLGIK